MHLITQKNTDNRPLTTEERLLVHWMILHGKPEAAVFLAQLEHAQVTPWRCPCGCASFNLAVDEVPPLSGGMHIIADFIFGEKDDLAGIFIFQ